MTIQGQTALPASPRVIAICGKGGVGKTTLCALLARSLAAPGGGKVLLVDADPAEGLALALGIRPRRTLDEIRSELIEELGRGATDRVDMAASADYRLLEILEERDNLAFFSVGRPEEAGCFCQLNTFLRSAIETLGSAFSLTLVDAEAGVEQVNRRVMRSISHLLLVTDLSRKGFTVAETIHRVAGQDGGGHRVGLVVNRAPHRLQATQLAAQTALPLVAVLPEDSTVAEFDARGRSFLELPTTAASLVAVRQQLLASDFFGEPEGR